MDSNVTWMGKVPSSWKKFMIGQLFEQVKEKNEGMIENNLLSLSYGKIKRKYRIIRRTIAV